MIIFGVIVLIVGLIAKIPILETIGVVLAVVGGVLMLLGAGGHGSQVDATTGSEPRAQVTSSQ